MVKPSVNSPKRSSVISLTQLKIPCFEWKDGAHLGNKTAEYYLNIYYYQLSNGNIKNNAIKNSMVDKKDKEETNNNIIDELPFILK